MRARGAAVLLTLVLASLTPGAARAQEESIEHRYQSWLALFAHGPLHQDLWLWVDVQPRLYGPFEPAALLVRPGLSWRVHPAFFLTVGYAWTPSWRQRPEPRSWGSLDFTDEHRVWEQALLVSQDDASGIGGQVRVRLEQRLRTSGGGDVGLRLRVFLRGQVPLVPDRSVLFVLWDELFVPLSDADWGQRAGFDQNRLFVGLAWQAVPGALRLELGAMSQWIVRTGRDTANTIAALNAFVAWR
ncbi:MAG: DUF2490 domain-containing protein [Sandaracinaceae bacterium]